MLNDAVEACSSNPSGTSPRREIRFTDSQLESSEVLSRFLTFMMRGRLPSWSDTFAECAALCRTIGFMRKYDCEFVLSFLRIYVLELFRADEMAPLFLFMVAAAMDDVDISIRAFGKRELVRDRLSSRRFKLEGSADSGIPGAADPKMAAALLELSLQDGGDDTWPFELAQHIPADYLWAASKAWSKTWGRQSAKDALQAKLTDLEEAAAEQARAAKRQRTTPPSNTFNRKTHDAIAVFSRSWGNVGMAHEYEVAIKAVKKITT